MLKTIIFLSLLVLAGCRYDVDYLYVIDTDHNVCSKRKVTNRDTWASRWVEDLPIEACDGFVSITPEDFAKISGRKK